MFRKPRQFQFFKPSPKSFGGSLLRGNPRGARPISIKNPTHLVLRSSHATRDYSFLHKSNRRKVDHIVANCAKRLSVRIYGYENVGNHLHMNLLFPSRRAYINFVRSISGLIARAVLGAERGRQSLLEKFWDARPYTRVISWGREFSSLKSYFKINNMEAIGFGRAFARTVIESTA